MLLDALSQYLAQIEASIRTLKNAYIERYEEEIITTNRINLRVRIRFQNGHLLEINEATIVDEELQIHLGYRYHFQDEHNHLVFRYDNTPHFPKLDNFPHHKHLREEVIGIAEPSIFQIIAEVKKSYNNLL